jgi:hypothetical protein
MPDLTSGKQWSAADLQDLHEFLQDGTPVEKIAELMMRDVDDVQEKINLLGGREG